MIRNFNIMCLEKMYPKNLSKAQNRKERFGCHSEKPMVSGNQKGPSSTDNSGCAKKISYLLRLIAIVGICIVFAMNTDAAGTIKSSEYVLKATFLYNFAKFTEWPEGAYESPEAPVNLCIIGKNPFGKALRAIADKNVRGRPLSVRESRDVAQKCHILFISSSEEKNLPNILSKIKGEPCLTISDMDGFVRLGGMIRFFMMGKNIRFEVNPDAARRSHLKISSRLLKLAQIYREDAVKKGELQ